MTLRLRMVLAIVVLVTIGLGTFGVVTYSLYSRSQYQRLDAQLKSSVPIASQFARVSAGLDDFSEGFPRGNSTNGSGAPGSGSGSGPNGQPPNGPASDYVELRDSTGRLVTAVNLTSSTATPKLDDVIVSTSHTDNRFFTTASSNGSGEWRIYVTQIDRPSGDTLVIASPLTEVANSLARLVLIESISGASLLALLAAGSWLILRHGLRPLELMAGSAGTITAATIGTGSLAERVSPDDGRTEIGRLGSAINTMLGEIEAAFRERDATEARLRQFLADASHELRTPLTSIQGFAELFRMDAHGDREQLEVIFRRIESESARMRTLVEDLLLLTRLDETRPAERLPVDVTVLAADACGDVMASDRTRQVTLDAPEPAVIAGDEDHLRQAIGNLVTNAVQHTEAGSPIEVSVRLDDGSAVVTVRDHGDGLADDDLEHVFDRFWQADSARVGSGSGLGLAIVRGIAEEHHGSVSVANADDGGAMFTLRLPIS